MYFWLLGKVMKTVWRDIMNYINNIESKNNAFYFEICILQVLVHMGYINEKDYYSIAEIAAEDYESTILLN